MAAAYSAFARQGKAGKLRLQPGDPLLERPLMSAGAAWIIRRIMADEAQPLPDNALSRVVPLAWKTGTSYGYRDAWAIGVNARYVIGIWTGRPDGTPVVASLDLPVPCRCSIRSTIFCSLADKSAGRSTPWFRESRRGVLAGRAIPCPRRQQLPSPSGNLVTGWQSAANVIIARAGRG
ncbi:penicillin-binding protein 1C [Citrobacter portucalensis]|nr:penicillin-binding protein 1C [Citrobacter portucalensis]